MLRRQVLRSLQRCSQAAQPVRALATAAPPSPNDAFANGTNAYYVEEMYRHWRQDPKSVHASWDAYFSGMDRGLSSPQAFQPPPTLLPQPIGSAPALDVGRGAKLDDHLKVSRNKFYSPFPLQSQCLLTSISVCIRCNYLFVHIKFEAIMLRIWIPWVFWMPTWPMSNPQNLSSVNMASPKLISTRRLLLDRESCPILPQRTGKPYPCAKSSDSVRESIVSFCSVLMLV